MIPNLQGAYENFLQTGMVLDYLKYIDIKQKAENAVGETIAYHDGRDCAAGTAVQRF